MKKIYTYEDVFKEFIKRAKAAETFTQFSHQTGISKPVICEILSNRRGLSKTTIRQLGFDAVYLKKESKCSKD
jgi:hypothetical protein